MRVSVLSLWWIDQEHVCILHRHNIYPYLKSPPGVCLLAEILFSPARLAAAAATTAAQCGVVGAERLKHETRAVGERTLHGDDDVLSLWLWLWLLARWMREVRCVFMY